MSHTAPELNGTGFVRFDRQDLEIQLDWSETFRLNGILHFYVVVRVNDEVHVDQQTSEQSTTLREEPRGISK